MNRPPQVANNETTTIRLLKKLFNCGVIDGDIMFVWIADEPMMLSPIPLLVDVAVNGVVLSIKFDDVCVSDAVVIVEMLLIIEDVFSELTFEVDKTVFVVSVVVSVVGSVCELVVWAYSVNKIITIIVIIIINLLIIKPLLDVAVEVVVIVSVLKVAKSRAT